MFSCGCLIVCEEKSGWREGVVLLCLSEKITRCCSWMTSTSNFTLQTSYPKRLYRGSLDADWDKYSFLRSDAIRLFSYLFFLKTVFSVVLALLYLSPFISHWLTYRSVALYPLPVSYCDIPMWGGSKNLNVRTQQKKWGILRVSWHKRVLDDDKVSLRVLKKC